MPTHDGQPGRRQPQRALWAVVPLAACLGGCCPPTHHAGVVPPDEPQLAAKRGLDRILNSLGGDDKSGKMRASITAFAGSHDGNKKFDELGESLNDIIARSTFRDRGFHATFNADSEKAVGGLVAFLNGPTSPLQGWNGWRYRSGIMDRDQRCPDPKMDNMDGPKGRSITAVIFEETRVEVRKCN